MLLKYQQIQYGDTTKIPSYVINQSYQRLTSLWLILLNL
jgi:hypothetical protein